MRISWKKLKILSFVLPVGVAEPELEPRVEEPKLNCLPVVVEIMNCGSISCSGSFLFIKDLKKFYRKKSRWLEKFL
jgi:hypothetical protein